MVHGLSVFSLQLCQAHFKMILTDKPTIRATGGRMKKKLNERACWCCSQKNKSFGLYKISCAWIYHQYGSWKNFEFGIAFGVSLQLRSWLDSLPWNVCHWNTFAAYFTKKKRWRICNNISFKMVTFFWKHDDVTIVMRNSFCH